MIVQKWRAKRDCQGDSPQISGFPRAAFWNPNVESGQKQPGLQKPTSRAICKTV